MRTTTPKARRPARPAPKPLAHTGILNIVPHASTHNKGKVSADRLARPDRKKPSTPRRVVPRSATHKRRASLWESAKAAPKLKRHSRKLSMENHHAAVVKKFAHATRQGVIPGNPDKVNQDSFFEYARLGPHSDVSLFGVCDGHGQCGHMVSAFVKQRLPALLAQDRRLLVDTRKALHGCILKCNEELQQLDFDTNFSGTTLILVLIKGRTLWCANVGDSRAVVGRQLADESGRHWMAIALSRDHKPDLKEEEVRIIANGGRVASYLDEDGEPAGPARVWLKHEDVPGLAMSRSLGDQLAASVGVIAVPEILEFQLTPHDKFILLGSDGVFEFISNEEAVKIAIPSWKRGNAEEIATMLEQESVARWHEEEDVVDDITSIAIFLDVL